MLLRCLNFSPNQTRERPASSTSPEIRLYSLSGAGSFIFSPFTTSPIVIILSLSSSRRTVLPSKRIGFFFFIFFVIEENTWDSNVEGKREGRSFSLQQTSWDLLFLNSLCCRPFCEIQFGFVLFFLLSIYLSFFSSF